MPKKIKIVLIIVAIVAGFSVYALAQYVHEVANRPATYQQGSPLPTASDDPDHDGLSNQQEVIWGTDPFNPDTDRDGFKDGEEVKSGHNPLVPGPDDLINADNLTEQFSLLTVAGLAEGSLQPDNENYAASMMSITDAITDSATYLFNKEVNDEQIKTVDTNTRNVEVYLNTVAPLTQSLGQILNSQFEDIMDHMDRIGKDGITDPEIKNYYKNRSSEYQSLYDKGWEISVPKNLKKAHAQFLSLALQMRDISASIASGDSDPIKATFALDAFGGILDKYIALAEAFQAPLEAIGFDPALIRPSAQ